MNTIRWTKAAKIEESLTYTESKRKSLTNISMKEGGAKGFLPALNQSIFSVSPKTLALVKPYPPLFKTLNRYGGFARSCWQNACNVAHDRHSPSQGASAIYNSIRAHALYIER